MWERNENTGKIGPAEPKDRMARIEADREDLFAEARALVRRIEARSASGSLPILLGLRETGWLSLYIGPDLMYQFDRDGRLRRAFVQGELYRTQGETLARLRRDRSEQETTLQRYDLLPDDLEKFQSQLQQHVGQLVADLQASRLEILRREPADDPRLLSDLLAALCQTRSATPWLAPAITRKT